MTLPCRIKDKGVCMCIHTLVHTHTQRMTERKKEIHRDRKTQRDRVRTERQRLREAVN